MAKKQPLRTAGTQLWVLNHRTKELVEVGCLTGMGTISNPKQLEDSGCLGDLVETQSVVGQGAGSTTIGVRFDHRESINYKLFEAYQNDDELTFALGFPQFGPDGKQIHPDDAEKPTVDGLADDPTFVFGGERVYLMFDGQLTDFPIEVNRNAYFDISIPVTIQGGVQFAPEEALPEYVAPGG